jgi:DNA-binding NtrC family response regulator
VALVIISAKYDRRESPVATHRSAPEGLADTTFKLLLCDVRLPDGDCSELFMNLLKQGVVLPLTLFITGYPDLEQAVKLLGMGASDYIAKPFDITRLLEKSADIFSAPWKNMDGACRKRRLY